MINLIFKKFTIFICRFLRSQKEYNPPKGVKQRIESFADELKITEFKDQKFAFLNKCAEAFGGHAVPNSRVSLKLYFLT